MYLIFLKKNVNKACSKIAASEYCFCQYCPSVHQCVRPTVGLSACINWVSAGRIFIKFNIWLILETLSKKFMIHYNVTRIMGTLHEDRYSSFITFRSLLLRKANVSDKRCRVNNSTYLTLGNILSKIVLFATKCEKKGVVPVRKLITIQRIRVVCWISKAVKRHSRNV